MTGKSKDIATQTHRKVIYSMLVSLDGFIEGPNRELDWHVIDEEFHTHVNEQERATDIYLYGRRMYEIMAEYWARADADPSNPEYVVEYARIWKSVPKIVFSKTLDKVEGNARLVRDNIAEEVTKLKDQPGKDLRVSGASIAATFMQLGLIDEYQLYVQPVVLGGGTPMFRSLDNKIELRLVETRKFGSGVVFLRYQRKGYEPESDLPTELASPAKRALAAAGYSRLEQFTTLTEAEVLQLHSMGPKALNQIRQALAAKGLSFAGTSRDDL